MILCQSVIRKEILALHAICMNVSSSLFEYKCIDIDITCNAHLSHLWSNITESEKNGKSSNKAGKNDALDSLISFSILLKHPDSFFALSMNFFLKKITNIAIIFEYVILQLHA